MPIPRLVRVAVLIAAIALTSAPPALASDGVLEINQACVATGCVPGDVPGFPVTLLNEGSYRLTSNLVVPPAVSGAIFVDNLIDLDLNGFAIKGPGSCSGTAGSVTCVGLSGYGVFLQNFSQNARPSRVHDGSITGVSTGLDVRVNTSVVVTDVSISGAGTGILGDGASISIEGSRVEQTSQSCMFFIEPIANARSVVSVRSSLVRDCHDSGIAADSTIRLSVTDSEVVGIGNLGILAGVGSVIRNVRVAASGSDGLSCSDSCSVEGSRFLNNGGRGIVVGEFSVVRDVEVRSSVGTGIVCGRNCMIARTAISNGGGGGIQADYVSTLVDNALDFNDGAAIVASDGSIIRGNSIGAATGSGSFPGIKCGVGCSAVENVVRNSSQPLDLGARSGYRRNVFSLYPFDAVIGTGTSGGDNLCDGASC